MKRSVRSIPTGVGSRGGHGKYHRDDPEFWSVRSRDWKAAHPEYREREKVRLALRRARRNDDRPDVVFTDAIRSLLARGSFRAMARELLVEHSTICRIVNERRQPSGATIDAVVAAFGISEVMREWRSLRAASREGRDGIPLATRLASTPAPPERPLGTPQEIT